jgi:hypothetical protein
MFLNHFNLLISKIIFKNKKKYYFNTFSSKKHFEKQLQPQTNPIHDKKIFVNLILVDLFFFNFPHLSYLFHILDIKA